MSCNPIILNVGVCYYLSRCFLTIFIAGQIGFINFVSKPCFTLLNEVCLSVSEDEKPWLKYMKSNVEYWEEKKKEYAAINNVESNVMESGKRESSFIVEPESKESIEELIENEELRIFNLNQDEASEMFHLFTVDFFD